MIKSWEMNREEILDKLLKQLMPYFKDQIIHWRGLYRYLSEYDHNKIFH